VPRAHAPPPAPLGDASGNEGAREGNEKGLADGVYQRERKKMK
jgi:hypothetical protein